MMASRYIPKSGVQVALSFDTTGSMMTYLERVRDNIDETIKRLFEAVPDIEIGICAHGDYCDSNDYVTKYKDFCSKHTIGHLKKFIYDVNETTGGDFPECYELVLHEAQSKFSWRSGGYGALVMIGDAIPHEANHKDNVNKLDWKEEARKLYEEMGVRVYSVQCESGCGGPEADDFWKELAEIGGGSYLKLTNIEDIVDFILAICFQEAEVTPEVTPVVTPEKEGRRMDDVRSLDNVMKSLSMSVPKQRTVIKNPQMDTDQRGATGSGSRLDSSMPNPKPSGSGGEESLGSSRSSDFSFNRQYGKYDGKNKDKWRDVNLSWDSEEYETKRDEVAACKPLRDEANTYKILLCGNIRAGKSSVVNTLFTALRNEIGQIAFNAEDEKSVTTRYRVYKLRRSIKERAIRVTICDTMGFEVTVDGNNGPSIRDFEYIMDGHIKDGYGFKPDVSISYNSEFFLKDPKPMDKVHAVIVVVDAAMVSQMSSDIVDKLKEVTAKANDRDIRWAVVMTKIDQACGEVNKDLTKVFSSRTMEDCAEAVHEKFGVISSNIFPIQNYGDQVRVNLPMNILALHTLESILRLADNTLESQPGMLDVDAPQVEIIKLLEEPWRNEDNVDQERMETTWSDLTALNPTAVEKLRICLMGPQSGGKSAYINSVNSEFYQRVTAFAEAGKGDTPTTKTYREYTLRLGRDGEYMGIMLIDTMGFMSETGGMIADDVATVLDGKAEKSAPFHPGVPMPHSDAPTSLNERMHVLVIVVNGAEFRNYDETMLQQLIAAKDAAKAQPREIPCVVLATHIDEICEHVKADPSVVFRSRQVKECLENIYEKLQVPMVDIHPVYNYCNDTQIDAKKSALIVQALFHQTERAQDYISSKKEPAKQKKKGWFW